MNVDIKKLKKEGVSKQFLDTLKKCEVRPVRKCFECGETQGIENPACVSCFSSPNLTDNFKPERNKLANLFVGAPIRINWEGETETSGAHYSTGYSYEGAKIRLPTLEESPRNTWLAPPLDMPEGLDALPVIFRLSDLSTFTFAGFRDLGFKWDEVQAFQIMEDFKK